MKSIVLISLFIVLCYSGVYGQPIFEEHFNTVTPPTLPAGWSTANVNGDSYTWVTSSGYTHTSTTPNCLYIRYNTSQAMNDWAFSSGVSLTGGTDYTIEFFYRSSSSYPEKLRLKYGTSPTVAGMSLSLTDIGSFQSSAWLQATVAFTPPSTGTYFFGWQGYSDADMYYMCIDDIAINEVTGLLSPSNLNVSNITKNSARLSWQENNNPAATAWEIVYGLPGFNPNLATPISVGTNPYVLSGLTHDTQYQWYVRSYSATREVSNWGGPGIIVTLPDVDFWLLETVENDSPTLVEWTQTAGSGQWYLGAASAYGIGTQSFEAPFYNISGSDPFHLFSPAFDIRGFIGLELNFDYAYATYINEVDQLDVYYSTDAGATFNLLLSMPGGLSGILNTAGANTSSFTPNASQWENINVSIPSTANLLRFTATSAYGNNLYLDNLMITGFFGIPDGVVTEVDGIPILLHNLSANIDDAGVIPPINNGEFIPSFSVVLIPYGSGPTPWTFTLDTDAPWGAYYWDGHWNAVENSGGQISFSFTPTKDAGPDIPIVLGDVDPTLPFELASFTVNLNAHNDAVLTWVTESETGMTGFYIYRNSEIDLATSILVSDLIPATNSSSEQSYSFTDRELSGFGTFYYWLQISNLDGSESFQGPISLVYLGGNGPQQPGVPMVTKLKSIFPNPFNPNVNLSYSLADDALVSVKIYNHRGQLVRTLNEGTKPSGHHSTAWDGKDDNGNIVATGIYLFRMQAGEKVFNGKAVLMK